MSILEYFVGEALLVTVKGLRELKPAIPMQASGDWDVVYLSKLVCVRVCVLQAEVQQALTLVYTLIRQKCKALRGKMIMYKG